MEIVLLNGTTSSLQGDMFSKAFEAPLQENLEHHRTTVQVPQTDKERVLRGGKSEKIA